MALFDVFRGQFIDVIEWTEPSQNDILAYRFPRHNNEIKMGAKLIVREGQTALFVNEGVLTDIFLNGRTAEEVCAANCIPESHLKVVLFRAKARFREVYVRQVKLRAAGRHVATDT